MAASFPKIVPGLSVVYRSEEGAPNKELGGDVRVVQGRNAQNPNMVQVAETFEGPATNWVPESRFWSTFRPITLDEAFDKPTGTTQGDITTPDEPVEIVAEVVAPEEAKQAEGDAIADSLRSWWLDVASQEVEPLIAKMFEYGGTGRANDLSEIGHALIEAGVKPGPLTGHGNVQDGYAAELGVYFYLKGKMARWSAAIAEGRPVSDDTLLDIGIYVRMVQRIRAIGGWPV